MKKILFTTALFILGALFTSCNKNEIQQGITATKDQFHSVLRMNMNNIGTNFEVQFDIPVREAEKSLDPVIIEAKKYLYSKGFTVQEIQEMIAIEGATEYDLIPLVIFLQETEFPQNENPFFQCAAVVIGADVIGVPSPSKTAIKQTFSASVSKASGPVAAAC